MAVPLKNCPYRPLPVPWDGVRYELSMICPFGDE